jgi:hypothetical protein
MVKVGRSVVSKGPPQNNKSKIESVEAPLARSELSQTILGIFAVRGHRCSGARVDNLFLTRVLRAAQNLFKRRQQHARTYR